MSAQHRQHRMRVEPRNIPATMLAASRPITVLKNTATRIPPLALMVCAGLVELRIATAETGVLLMLLFANGVRHDMRQGCCVLRKG
jgi:hypothetical protein